MKINIFYTSLVPNKLKIAKKNVSEVAQKCQLIFEHKLFSKYEKIKNK